MGILVRLAAALSLSATASVAASLPDYKLGPQDRLQIRVFDMRLGNGEAYQWTAFNGEFLVGASGEISLPLVGDVVANGETPATLGAEVARRLQEKAGLANKPDASVQVVKYRPFYVVGEVTKPGEYEYQPGLTVLQAVGGSGGVRTRTDPDSLAYERDALAQRGDLRVLAAQRLGLLVRQARLDAVVSGADHISLPVAVTSRAGDPDVARAIREEQLLFDSRREGLNSQTQVILEAKTFLQQEIESLDSKDASLQKQLELAQRDLSQVNSLAARGLIVAPRQLAAEQVSASYETNRLDVEVSRLRARQELSRGDRDILSLRERERSTSLTEATEVRSKLAEITERMQTAQGLIYQLEVRAPVAVADERSPVTPIYVLSRASEGSQARIVQQDDLVQPGDVVKVVIERKNSLHTLPTD